MKNYLTESISKFVATNNNSSLHSEINSKENKNEEDMNAELTEEQREQIKEYINFVLNKAENCILVEDKIQKDIINHDKDQKVQKQVIV